MGTLCGLDPQACRGACTGVSEPLDSDAFAESLPGRLAGDLQRRTDAGPANSAPSCCAHPYQQLLVDAQTHGRDFRQVVENLQVSHVLPCGPQGRSRDRTNWLVEDGVRLGDTVFADCDPRPGDESNTRLRHEPAERTGLPMFRLCSHNYSSWIVRAICRVRVRLTTVRYALTNLVWFQE
jgi:hypothetical protein